MVLNHDKSFFLALGSSASADHFEEPFFIIYLVNRSYLFIKLQTYVCLLVSIVLHAQ